MQAKKVKRNRIHHRIRAKIFGTKECPRLCVFRSANHVYAQLIDDENGKVVASASDVTMKKGTKVSHAAEVGKRIAKAALEKRVERVIFDRGGFVFHGRVKAVADGARQGGLKF